MSLIITLVLRKCIIGSVSLAWTHILPGARGQTGGWNLDLTETKYHWVIGEDVMPTFRAWLRDQALYRIFYSHGQIGTSGCEFQISA